MSFKFKIPGILIDDDLELILIERREAETAKARVPEYKFEMRHIPADCKVGNIALRTSLTSRLAEYGGHIGYDVLPKHRGAKYSARSCKLLFNLARMHDINPILITCSPDNMASVKTCEAIGGNLVKQQKVATENGVLRVTNYYHIVL
jgi:tagatose 1,6-diphosphate aldolase